MNVSSALARQAVVPVRCRAGKGTPGRARKTLRRALTSKEPSGSDAAEEGGRVPLNDPLSAMMNFISDVNPLASVFKSPDGACDPCRARAPGTPPRTRRI